MTAFKISAASLFVYVEQPLDAEAALASEDQRDAVIAMGNFLSRYLHERVHWIQYFSTFSGLIQVFAREIQNVMIGDCLSRNRAALGHDSFPLRGSLSDSTAMELWDCLELLSAVMAGDRSIAHYRHDYGGVDWSQSVQHGANLFSKVMTGARASEFEFPNGLLLGALSGITIDKIDVVLDDERKILGSTSLFELQAALAQIFKMAAYVDELTDLIYPFELHLPYRAAKMRDVFYEMSGLEKRSWREDLLCLEVSYYALNIQSRLFLRDIGDAETLSEISAFHKFAEMSTQLRRVAAALNAIAPTIRHPAAPP